MLEGIQYDRVTENDIPEAVKKTLAEMYRSSAFHSFGWVAEVYYNKYLVEWRVVISPEPQLPTIYDTKMQIQVFSKGDLPTVIWLDTSEHIAKRLNQLHAYRTAHRDMVRKMAKHLNDHVSRPKERN